MRDIMKWSIAIIVIILLIPSIALADRPDYSFSDDVFSELEPFPDDFWEIERLFSSQSIRASQLNESYFQPEILPTWSDICNDIYGTDKVFANQGIFIYPSRFDVYNSRVGNTLRISALIYAHPGVSTYQGSEVFLDFNKEVVNVTLLTNKTYVLGPTYPVFNNTWMQLLELKITIIDDKENTTVSIRERDPPYKTDKEFKNKYGKDNYSKCQSLLSEEVNRCTIYIHARQGEKVESQVVDDLNTFTIVLVGFVLFLFLILQYVYKQRRKKRRHNS